MTLEGNVIKKMTKFSLLGHVLKSGGQLQEVVTARIRSRWKKFTNIARVQSKRIVSMTLQESLCKCCVRSALGYSAK